MIRARDLIERVFWSFVSGFLGSLVATPLMLDVIENVADADLSVSTMGAVVIAAAFAGFTAAANVILVIARWRLTILPNPGDGLPGLPTTDTGGSNLPTLLILVLAALAYMSTPSDRPVLSGVLAAIVVVATIGLLIRHRATQRGARMTPHTPIGSEVRR